MHIILNKHIKYIALFSKEEYGSETGILYSDDDKDEKGVKFIKFCSRYIKRPIFEGVQVARIYFKDNSIFKDAAILIKGTSTVEYLRDRAFNQCISPTDLHELLRIAFDFVSSIPHGTPVIYHLQQLYPEYFV